MMGDSTLHAYSRIGGVVIGVLEIVFGIECILFQIPQFTEDVSLAVGATGIWAGLYYLIVGIVTLLAGLQRQPALVKASLGLSVFGVVITAAAISNAAIMWLLTGFNTISGYGDTYEHALETANWSNGLIITLSLLTFFLFITASILSCVGLQCCASCGCCRPEPEKMESI